MNKLLFSLLLGAAVAFSAGAQAPDYSAYGQLLLVHLDTAPFPHPQRDEGHKYGNEFYPADKHYRDNTVGIFIPKNFHASDKPDFVVHFHGWRHHVGNVLSHYELISQFADSRRNAILIVPQGPYDAPDSFGGKLEDENGFKNFMQDVLATLRRQQLVPTNAAPGAIILSGHSGGYQVISSILAQGGLTDHVREVWLFDALYARTEKFMNWFDHTPNARFIDIYTGHGGTKAETETLIATLEKKHTPHLATRETDLKPSDLTAHPLLFIFTDLPHDDVMMKHHTFADYLKTSFLQPMPSPQP